MSRRVPACAWIFAVAILTARAAAAQPAIEAGRLELSAGAAWLGHESFGSVDATETTNSGGTFKLFTASSELAAAAGFDARVGVRVAGTLVIEADASFGKPELRATIANDVEGAPGVTAAERVKQYTIGGGATWYVPTTSRLVPFAAGGAGYLRQLHERGILVETGRYYEIGGGVVYLLNAGRSGALKATGVRVDVRANIFQDGVSLDGGTHVAPAIVGSLVFRF
ncbi:MAG TPA: hypothetical protein VKD69_18965 [Vicinamibacterales bacterium]|nr:hypothetical protein [Vicinamibacterales bacterium]